MDDQQHQHKKRQLGIVENVSDFIMGIGELLGYGSSDYIAPMLVDQKDNYFITNKGELVSLIRINGVNSIVDNEMFERLHRSFEDMLKPILVKPGHHVQFVFEQDFDAMTDIDKSVVGQKKTAKSIGLAVEDLIDASAKANAKYCHREANYMVVWTTLSLFSTSEVKAVNAEFSKEYAQWPNSNEDGIAEIETPKRISVIHTSLVNKIVENLNSMGLMSELLSIKQSVLTMRRMIDEEFTSKNFKPILPGDKARIPYVRKPQNERNISMVLAPSLKKQIWPRVSKRLNHKWFEVGDKWFAPIIVTLPPMDPKPFNSFFSGMLGSNTPYRLVILLSGGEPGLIGIKQVFAQLLGMFAQNKKLIRVVDDLKAYKEAGGVTASFRMIATTWADAGDEKTLRIRASSLASTLQSWGTCDTSEASGDPAFAFSATIPCLMSASPSPASEAPIEDVATMLPITRPNNFWPDGGMMLRSPDGKFCPFQPNSSKQTAWVELISAPMGYGKSVFLNYRNFAFCVKPGLASLPYLSILDIGVSSSGLISLLKAGLGKDREHLAQYHRLKPIREHAINFCDTPLGMREPTPTHFNYMKQFLVSIFVGDAKIENTMNIRNAAEMVLRLAFSETSKHAMKKYASDASPVIHRFLVENNITFDIDGVMMNIVEIESDKSGIAWWEIVDRLYDLGHLHYAKLAQRYAVPNLSELMGYLSNEAITSDFAQSEAEVLKGMVRSLKTAVAEIPNLQRETQFEIGDARVISLDLDEVCPKGDNWRAGVMYSLALMATTRRFYMQEEDLVFVPPRYRAYHKDMINELKDIPKGICFDEFHRTSGIDSVAKTIEQIVREGRKWQVVATFASQSIDDFHPIIRELSSSRFILGVGSEATAVKICEYFSLNGMAAKVMSSKFNKPGASGANVFCSHATESGPINQWLMLTLPAQMMWAFSTTASDRRIRDNLYKRFPEDSGLVRDALSQRFPGGSCAKYLEAQGVDANDDDVIGSSEGSNVMRKLEDELIGQIEKIRGGLN